MAKLTHRISVTSSKDVKTQYNFGAAIGRQVILGLRANAKFKKPDEAIMKYINQKRIESIRLTKAYYLGLLDTLGVVLDNERIRSKLQSNPLSKTGKDFSIPIQLVKPRLGAESTLKLPKINLEPGRQTRKAWPQLPRSYMAVDEQGNLIEPYGEWKGLPKSRSFWYKTGTLAKVYNNHLDRLRPQLGQNASYGLTDPIKVKPLQNTKQSLFTASYQIRIPVLKSHDWNRIIRESFVSTQPRKFGLPAEYPFMKPQPNNPFANPARLNFPEQRRPMIARFSAKAGAEYRNALAGFFSKYRI